VLLVRTNKNGIADVLAHTKTHICYIETKRVGKEARELQHLRLYENLKHAHVACVYDGTQDIDKLLAGDYNVSAPVVDPLGLF